jgi:cysteine desulfurase
LSEVLAQRPRIYLDHAATTPMLPAAKAAMVEAMDRWANPSSPHAEGRAARAALEGARERIKRALGWDGELIFTSGATEAIEIALSRAKGGRRLISAVEHEAVFRTAPDAGVLPIGNGGELDLAALATELRQASKPVVAVQHVNSETGKEQNVTQVAELVRNAGGLVVSDCAQSAGKLELPDADMLVVSAHKLGGPPGIGALLVRDLSMLEPGGGQERGYRSGTENLPAVLGFAAALNTPRNERSISDPSALTMLHDVWNSLYDAGARQPALIGGVSLYIEAWIMPHMSASAQLIRFDLSGISVSAGSACSSGSLKPSRALRAFGLTDEEAARCIRVSIGWSTTPEDLLSFATAWLEIAEDAKKRAA